MKRSAFKRRTPSPRVATQYTGTNPSSPRVPARVAAALTAWMGVQEPKREYVRNAALRQACRSLPCQHCGISDSSVCGAHSNWAVHGKGKSIRASDQYIAAMCVGCHYALDQGPHMSRQERFEMWDAAHRNTVVELIRRGLWPAGVEVPT